MNSKRRIARWLRSCHDRIRGRGCQAQNRRGTVIIVVLALLGSLALLGFLIYTLAAQEETNAELFSDAAKEQQETLGCNTQFNFALRQLLLGADFDEYHSALWGGRNSLVPTMFGRDLQPFSGHGVNFTYPSAWRPGTDVAVNQLVRPTRLSGGGLDQHYICGTAGQTGTTEPAWGGPSVVDGGVTWNLVGPLTPFVDQNFDDISDTAVPPFDPQTLSEINLSPAAQQEILDLDDSDRPFPEPDVDYTYPDINNVFVHFEEQVPQGTADPLNVVLPSFDRPQFLRNVIADPLQWQVDPASAGRVLRPHVEHRAVTSDGVITTERRFVSTVADATGLGMTGPFPFPAAVNEGIWSLYAANPATAIDYGADPDGDGINEAFFMDLSAPILETPDGSQKYVPMYAITVKPLDSLINLNTAGNLRAADLDTDSNNEFDNPLGLENVGLGFREYVSRSNQATSPAEVNPEWALVARPALRDPNGPFPAGLDVGTLDSDDIADLDAALEQHRLMYRLPSENDQNPTLAPAGSENVELANMELVMLLAGRGRMVPGSPDPMVDPAVVSDLYAGRWGEGFEVLLAALDRNDGNPNTFPLPSAGTSQMDDNNNQTEGLSFIHPFDYHATGRYTLAGTFGRNRTWTSIADRQFPVYTNYGIHASYPSQPYPRYVETDALHGGVLMTGTITGMLTDETTETSIEPVLAAQQTDDDVFGPGNNVLQLSNADLDSLNNPGRVLALAPYNFRADLVGSREEQIRKRFTATGFDLNAYGRPVFIGPDAKFRTWETNADTDTDTVPEFPPNYGTTAGGPTDPFRAELRNLLTLEAGDADDTERKLQRKLSTNGVLDRNPTTGDLRFRPLTAHPTGLGRDVIPDLTGAVETPEDLTAGNLQPQEWLARRDRQRMARDIYVLLYTLAGGLDTDYTVDNSIEAVHTFGLANPRIDELREMAQFAVNLVDALDNDNIVTVFEYDVNLNNGWGLNDISHEHPGYLEGSTPDSQPAERRVVYGVEAQQLAFSEALVILATRTDAMTPIDHEATEYDDTEHRDFTYIELENVSPNAVSFDNSAWQITVGPADTAAAPYFADPYGRRLTITDLQPDVPAGNGGSIPRMTIGTSGDNENVDAMGAVRPSHFRVDKDYDPLNPPPTFDSIAPPKDPPPLTPPGYLNMDLIFDTSLPYRIHQPQVQGEPGDGSQVPHDTGMGGQGPAGRELLHLAPTPGTFDGLPSDAFQIEIQLRRRVNPYRQEPILYDLNQAEHQSQSADNPWVVVDTIQVPIKVFALLPGDDITQIQSKLDGLLSTQRRQPLWDNLGQAERETPAVANVANTLIDPNQASTGFLPYSLWQPHFDRNFTSVMELFNVPLFGPYADPLTYLDPINVAADAATLEPRINGQVTRKLGSRSLPVDAWDNPPTTPAPAFPAPDWSPPTTLQTARLVGADTAGNRFLHPEGRNSDAADPTNDDNRWYRLLSYLEIPSRTFQDSSTPEVVTVGQIGNMPLPQVFRAPGRIDLNTLRHHEVLAALIDDREVISNEELDTSGATTNKAYLTDGLGDAASEGGVRRDWWEQFLLARDGLDPLAVLTLPGSPGARPFRSLSFALRGKHSLEDTIFRHLPKDELLLDAAEPDVPPSPDRRRRLFELGSEAEHDGSAGASPPNNEIIDYDLRHRLLQKVYNNSTNRSNVFAVFVEVAYFEAAEVSTVDGPVVRIGAKLPDDGAFQHCRGFFVIDRSRAFDLVESDHLPTPHEDPVTATPKFTYSFDRSFPWQSLVLHRQTLP